MIELLVTENKSFDPVRFYRNRVRIFLNKDYGYGLWIDEDRLFDLLDDDQKRQYLTDRTPEGSHFSISKEVGKKLLSLGHSPYKKQSL